MEIIIRNIDDAEYKLSDDGIINFANSEFDLNECEDTPLHRPETIGQSIHYINEYCSAIEIVKLRSPNHTKVIIKTKWLGGNI